MAAKLPELPADQTAIKRDHDTNEYNASKRLCVQDDDQQSTEVLEKRKLRKYVLLLSYCGKGYYGMQRNRGFKTIEDELLNAMKNSSLIKEEVVDCPQLYKFQRAARTDKGVSASKQIVSLKLPDYDDIPDMINKYLPEEIRVMKCVRVTQKFDAKSRCDSRSYSYMTPTFAFAPMQQRSSEEYRISAEVLQNLRELLNTYKGTHPFHNFTARVKAGEAKAKRYIMAIECSEPFVRDGLEWVVIKIKGQSFMMHQIRKMIGLCMAISKGFVAKNVFERTWKLERCDIPIAPGLGLVLEEPHYEYYNKKFHNDGFHEQLKWDSISEEIQTFREKFIDSVIIETEKKEKTTLTWLQTLFYHSFQYREDGPPQESPGATLGVYEAKKTLQEFQKNQDEGNEDSNSAANNLSDDSSSPPNAHSTDNSKDNVCSNSIVSSDMKITAERESIDCVSNSSNSTS